VSGHVNLQVFNVLGQKVTTVLDVNLPAGDHEVAWDGPDSGGHAVASGIYFYRLELAGDHRTKKMVLLK